MISKSMIPKICSCKGKVCTKFDKHSKFALISQNTRLFSIIYSLYFTKKCCRWIFIALSFPFNLRNSLRHFHLCLKVVTCIYRKATPFWGLFVNMCKSNFGTNFSSGTFYVCFSPIVLPQWLFGFSGLYLKTLSEYL